jgi:ABC-type phosphate transport system substrate-binding protein
MEKTHFYDEITGLWCPVTPPMHVVTIGWLAFSQHNSAAAARAWIKWFLTPEQQAVATIELM